MAKSNRNSRLPKIVGAPRKRVPVGSPPSDCFSTPILVLVEIASAIIRRQQLRESHSQVES